MRLWIFQIPKRYICKNLPTSSLFGIFSKKSMSSWLEFSYDCTTHEIEKNQKIYKYVTNCTTNSQNKVLHNLTENSSRAQRFGILKRNKNTGNLHLFQIVAKLRKNQHHTSETNYYLIVVVVVQKIICVIGWRPPKWLQGTIGRYKNLQLKSGIGNRTGKKAKNKN